MPACTLALELEERAVRVLTVRGRGIHARVVRAHSDALSDDAVHGLIEALRAALDGTSGRRCELRVALRNRLVCSGEVQVPGMTVKHPQAAESLANAARKLGVYAPSDDLVLGHRLRSAPTLDADVCVAPRVLLDQVQAAADHLGITRVTVLASETLLGTLSALHGEPLASLDLHGDRAIVVLARAGRVRAARRFKLPVPLCAEPDNGAEVAALLLGELTRSLAFFADQGKGDVTHLLLSGAFAPDGALVTNLQSMLPLPVRVATAPPLSGLNGTLALRYLVPRIALLPVTASLPPLLQPAHTPLSRAAALAFLQVAGAAALCAGGAMIRDARAPATVAVRDALGDAAAECAQLASEADALRAKLQEPAAVRIRRSILQQIDSACPARSALCAAIARGRPAALSFHAVRLDEDGTLTLAGIARTDDRLAALADLAALEAHLLRVPGVGHGRSSLRDASDGHIGFRFTAKLSEVLP